ncbi:hypothetical protein BLL42_27680 (plasmid) [Pseudomonas frederiksbergensis]|uniref:Uncharacterized protein n=1 Tax=Pseudomonas frederiksbergensis TaxID=104087 RepID=A0A1J0ETS9_9PSED|nr:hypothetical protein [Pseudomonas frederiksbergensis]APC19513.1 hypothetical protein BLL42_27680 [Pseudomonas frederiksbergensis]
MKDTLIPDHYSTLFARRLLNFTLESTKAHFEENPPTQGQILILSMQQHNMNRYRLVKVINPASGRRRRIIISHGEAFGGASYYRSGKSCFAPTGQTKLLPPVPAVAERLSFDHDTTLSDEDLAELLASG